MNHNTDFSALHILAKEYLLNQPLLRMTIGDELVFHLGTPQPYISKFQELFKGSVQLRVLHAEWQMDFNLSKTEEKIINFVAVSKTNLIINFGGNNLTIWSNNSEKELWKISSNGMVIHVFRDYWSHTSSDSLFTEE